MAKKNTRDPCMILNKNIDIMGKEFKIIGIFEKSKNKYLDLDDESIIVNFNSPHINNLGQKYISGFLAEVYIDKAKDFQNEIISLLGITSYRKPFCNYSAKELKDRKEIFKNLKSNTWLYFVVAFISIIVMDFFQKKNKIFFMFLNGFSKIEIISIEFVFLLFVFFPFISVSFTLNYISDSIYKLNNLNDFFAKSLFFYFKCLFIWLLINYVILTAFYRKRV